jgi:putative intracellular protease/amidase
MSEGKKAKNPTRQKRNTINVSAGLKKKGEKEEKKTEKKTKEEGDKGDEKQKKITKEDVETEEKKPKKKKINMKNFKLIVEIHKAHRLAKKDLLSESDPYVCLHMEDDNGAREVGRTTVIVNQPHPIWDEAFSLNVSNLKRLWVELWDQDVLVDDPLGYALLDPLRALGDNPVGSEKVHLGPRPDSEDVDIKGTLYINYALEEKLKRLKNNWSEKFKVEDIDDLNKVYKGNQESLSIDKVNKKLKWNVSPTTLTKIHSLMNVAPENQLNPGEELTKENAIKMHGFITQVKPQFESHSENDIIKGHEVYKAIGQVSGIDIEHVKHSVSKNSEWGLDHYAKAAACITTASNGFKQLLKEKEVEPNLWNLIKTIKFGDIGSLILSKFEPPLKDLDGEYKYVKKFKAQFENEQIVKKTIFFPLPDIGVWASECSVAWKYLSSLGHKLVILTETGKIPLPDPLSLEGLCGGLYPSSSQTAIAFWNDMVNSEEGQHPIPWLEAKWEEADCVVVVGGHHPGMNQMLKCRPLQRKISKLWLDKRIIFAAMCHGNLMYARARDPETMQPIYWNLKGTCLPRYVEYMSYVFTRYLVLKSPESYQLSTTWPFFLEESIKISMKNGDEQYVRGDLNVLLAYYSDYKKTDVQLVVETDNFVSCRVWTDNWVFATAIARKLIAQKPRK